ncbi:MAG: hypothetical protein WC314_25200 [Vulcanimicrobiota bacterium]
MDISEQIVKWEEGEMSEQEEVDFFQYLVDTGAAWHLPSTLYQDRAKQLIAEGKVSPYGRFEDSEPG